MVGGKAAFRGDYEICARKFSERGNHKPWIMEQMRSKAGSRRLWRVCESERVSGWEKGGESGPRVAGILAHDERERAGIYLEEEEEEEGVQMVAEEEVDGKEVEIEVQVEESSLMRVCSCLTLHSRDAFTRARLWLQISRSRRRRSSFASASKSAFWMID